MENLSGRTHAKPPIWACASSDSLRPRPQITGVIRAPYSPRRVAAWPGPVTVRPPTGTRDDSSCRQFGCQHVNRLDVGRGREELIGALHEGGGDGAVKMRLAARGGREEVGNSEGRRVNLDREPGGRLGLGLSQRQGGREKPGELILLSRLGLHRDEKSHGDHVLSLLNSGWPDWLYRRPVVPARYGCGGLSLDVDAARGGSVPLAPAGRVVTAGPWWGPPLLVGVWLAWRE